MRNCLTLLRDIQFETTLLSKPSLCNFIYYPADHLISALFVTSASPRSFVLVIRRSITAGGGKGGRKEGRGKRKGKKRQIRRPPTSIAQTPTLPPLPLLPICFESLPVQGSSEVARFFCLGLSCLVKQAHLLPDLCILQTKILNF